MLQRTSSQKPLEKENRYFDLDYLRLILEQHRSGREDNGRLSLGILGIQLRNDLFARRGRRQAVAEPWSNLS